MINETDIEAFKYYTSLDMEDYQKQAADTAIYSSKHGKGEPVVFFRADRKSWITMISLEHYMDLLKNWK